MTVRDALPDDVDRLAVLLGQLGYPADLDEVGAPRCRLTAIAVDAAARSHGVGRALLDEVEQRARAAGRTTIEATSSHRPAREAAHRFYPAVGFTDGTRGSAFYTKHLVDGVP